MHIYFSGIGGVGLGPLAEIARGAGHTISGSDLAASPTFLSLQKEGFEVSLDQTSTHMAKVHTEQPIDWFVYTAALPPNHPELAYAREHDINATKRDELLKKIIEGAGQKLIAVAGTHGKTTTTAMVVWLFKQLNIPVSYLVGAPMSWAPSGAYDKTAEYFVYECDEYDRNFLQFHPHLSLITSIAYDHADIYPTQENYNQAFEQFKTQSRQVLTWKEVDPNIISLPGQHNRSNGALAANAVAKLTAQYIDKLVDYMKNFPGTSRRFEKLAENLYTDYAHHPDEIAATLQLAGELSDHIIVVYQPHQNTRQYHVTYVDCFDKAEKIYWLPTYLSKEDTSLDILTPAQLTSQLDSKKVTYAEFSDDLLKHIRHELEIGKIVIIMGAGSIDTWARKYF
jgi:UDP-N-acetylmuramate--alanine ligase